MLSPIIESIEVVRDHVGFVNERWIPVATLSVNWREIPFVYERKIAYDQGEMREVYFAHYEGVVSFAIWNPQNETGFGGAEMQFPLTVGHTVTRKGCWSSRCGVMNQLGFEPSIEALFTTPDYRIKSAGALTVAVVDQALADNPRFEVHQGLTTAADHPYDIQEVDHG